MIKVLFVCMGNICRSPTAHAVMQHEINTRGLGNRISLDSAGTHAYHVGEQADPRSCAMAASQGVDMDFIRARKVSVNDYDEFDYILAMDQDNLDLVHYYAPQNATAEQRLFLSFANLRGTVHETEVPDPYYGGDDGFARVFNMVETGCQALIEHILEAD